MEFDVMELGIDAVTNIGLMTGSVFQWFIQDVDLNGKGLGLVS